MKTSIVILTYNKLDYTKQCIESIRNFTHSDYEIIIVDNASTDGTVEWLEQQKDIRVVLNKKNLGFPKGCNQGIEIATGDNILLLNNDVIVTENWLENLLTCLYSDESIGAVGPVTNSAAYYTSIKADYQTLDQMHEFARIYNQSNPERWDERLKLIGYCMLVKKDIVDLTGNLDEQFTPGNFEDDDYSLRIRRAGYKLILCKDTFIHHYGSMSWRDNLEGYTTLLSENEKKFIDKWGIASQDFIIHYDILDEIMLLNKKKINVLHIGCQAGGTLLEIKNKNKSANLYGIEPNETVASVAKQIGVIDTTSISNFDNSIIFDIALITNSQIFNNLNEIELLCSKMREDSVIIIKIDSNKISQYIKDSLTTMLKVNGFKLENIQRNGKLIIKATLLDNQLTHALKDIINNTHDEITNTIIEKYKTDDIIQVITSIYENPVEYLQALAIYQFSSTNYDEVLPYLEKALQFDPKNIDTLYNLSYVLKTFGELDLAKSYLEQTDLSDEETLTLYNEILAEIELLNQNKRLLIFLLRRLENDIEIEETINEMYEYLKNEYVNEVEIIEIIDRDIINKEKVLNMVAMICYSNHLYNIVLPFLNKAYDYNNKNDETLFNLGYFLKQISENQLALHYLENITIKDDEVLNLIEEIKEYT